MPRFFALVFTLLCFLAPAQAKTEWLHARSEHFEVFSSAGQGATKDLVTRLEDMYYLFGAIYAQKPRYELRTLVFYCGSDRDLKPFRRIYQGKPIEVSSIYLEPIEYPVIILEGTLSGADASSVVYNSMAHVMLGTLVTDAPTWFSTGFASLFQTIDMDGKGFTFGLHKSEYAQRVAQSRLIPLKDLLNVTTNSPIYNKGDDRGLFFAQSWAFTHMCFLGEDKTMMGKLKNYVMQESLEHDKAACMERVFGEPLKSLERKLESYIRFGRYSSYKGKMPADRSVKIEFLPFQPVELEAARSGVLHRIHGEDKYRNAALDAYRILADTDNEPLCAMASLHCKNLGEEELMGTLADRAIALNTRNPNVFLNRVSQETRNMPRTVTYRMPEEVAAQLRTWIDRGLELYPGCVALYKQLAYVEAFAPKLRVDKFNLLQKVTNQVADRDDLLVLLAYIRWRHDDPATAKSIMAQLKEESGLRTEMARELDRYLTQGKPWKRFL